MKSADKLYIQAHRIIGEYIGTLEGIALGWNIPKELKVKLEKDVKRLRKTKIILPDDVKTTIKNETTGKKPKTKIKRLDVGVYQIKIHKDEWNDKFIITSK